MAILPILGLLILGAIVGLTIFFNSLLSRSRDGEPGMNSWLSVPLAFIGAVAIVVGGAWAVLLAVCSGTSFH